MNDITPGAEVEGTLTYHGMDLYGAKVDPAEVRRRIGMVFQEPNPFPKCMYDNVAFGPRLNGTKRSEVDELVEKALNQAALWDEVHGKLRKWRCACPAVSSSGCASPGAWPSSRR